MNNLIHALIAWPQNKNERNLMAVIANLTAAVAANTASANECNRLIGIAIEHIGTGTPGTGATDAEQQTIADGVAANSALLDGANVALALKLGV